MQSRPLQTKQPRPELRSFVRVYAQRQIHDDDPVALSIVPPRLEQTLEFQFGETPHYLHSTGVRQYASPIMVVGASTRHGTFSLPGGTVSFGVFFQPNGFSRLFGLPMAEISENAHDASAILLRLLATDLAGRSTYKNIHK